MQVIEYKIEDKIITVGFKELDANKNPFVIYTQVVNSINLTKQELLKKAYIQIKSTLEYEKTLTEHNLTIEKEGEEFKLEDSKPVKLEIDFNNLNGKVLDQYGNIVATNVVFIIEGTDKAKIQNNKIVEESVSFNTEYYIIAKYKDLEEKQKRTIYVPEIVKEAVGKEKVAIAEAIIDLNNGIEKLKQEINILKGGK